MKLKYKIENYIEINIRIYDAIYAAITSLQQVSILIYIFNFFLIIYWLSLFLYKEISVHEDMISSITNSIEPSIRTYKDMNSNRLLWEKNKKILNINNVTKRYYISFLIFFICIGF